MSGVPSIVFIILHLALNPRPQLNNISRYLSENPTEIYDRASRESEAFFELLRVRRCTVERGKEKEEKEKEKNCARANAETSCVRSRLLGGMKERGSPLSSILPSLEERIRT